MSRPRAHPGGLHKVNLAWYPLALLPILLLVGAPIAGWLPILVLPLGLQWAGNFWVRIADTALLYVLLALGLNVVVGYAGLLDLGYVAFFAIGA